MKESEVTKLIAVLKAAYPTHPVEDATIVAYQMALDDIDYDVAMELAARHIKTSPFFPRPSELRPAAEPPRMDSRDYQGDAYLDVPWLTGARRDTIRALPMPKERISS